MSSDTLISLICPALHPEYWLEICQTLTNGNNTPFEVIFIGPNPPICDLPKEARYIPVPRDLKMPQCIEGACRLSKGEYVTHIADDFLFGKNFLNCISNEINKHDMNKYVIIPNLGVKWKEKVLGKYHGSNDKWPVVGLFAVMKKSVWMDLGGLDKRFNGICFNNDLILRFYERGGVWYRPPFNECHATEEKSRGSYLTKTYSNQDWGVILKLWHDDGGNLLSNRKFPVSSYEDKDILTINQYCE